MKKDIFPVQIEAPDIDLEEFYSIKCPEFHMGIIGDTNSLLLENIESLEKIVVVQVIEKYLGRKIDLSLDSNKAKKIWKNGVHNKYGLTWEGVPLGMIHSKASKLFGPQTKYEVQFIPGEITF